MKKVQHNKMNKYADSKEVLVDIAVRIIDSLGAEKWIFQGWIYSDRNQFKLTYHSKESEEEYCIEGEFDLKQRFVITYAKIAFLMYDENEDTELSFKVEIRDSKSLHKVNIACLKLLQHNKSYRYFMEDYHRYMNDNPITYIKQLISNSLIDFDEMEDYGEDLQYRYCGEYGEDEIEIAIDNNDSQDEEGYWPYDYIKVDVSDRFHYEYYEYQDKDIRSLFNMLNPVTIPIEDVIVIHSTRFCIYKDHPLQRMKALVCIMVGNQMKEIEAETLYCIECDAYYMSEIEFRRLKSIGHICCRVVTIEEFRKTSNKNSELNTQSLLRSYGYTTNAKDALTDRERQRILSFVIENEIMTIDQIIDFLYWVIRKHPHYNMALARAKWNRDISYLQEYKPVAGIIKVRDIFRKEYRIY